MLLKTIKITSRIACLLAILFTITGTSRVQAQSPSAICPAGWGHGSVAGTVIEETKLGCGSGVANLITFTIDESTRDHAPIGQFEYQAPSFCLSPTGVYVIVIQAKASNFAQTFEVHDSKGRINIYLDEKEFAYGQQPLFVRISSSICHAEASGLFEISGVNEQF